MKLHILHKFPRCHPFLQGGISKNSSNSFTCTLQHAHCKNTHTFISQPACANWNKTPNFRLFQTKELAPCIRNPCSRIISDCTSSKLTSIYQVHFNVHLQWKLCIQTSKKSAKPPSVLEQGYITSNWLQIMNTLAIIQQNKERWTYTPRSIMENRRPWVIITCCVMVFHLCESLLAVLTSLLCIEVHYSWFFMYFFATLYYWVNTCWRCLSSNCHIDCWLCTCTTKIP